MSQTQTQSKAHNKWVGYGLLYGSILFSFIFYIIVMAVGFKVPSAYSTQGNLGLWDLTIKPQGGVGSTLSDTGVTCIVFMAMSLGLLIAGFVVHNKASYTTNKFIKISVISSFIIFAIALIFALAGKVDVGPATSERSSINLSIWMKAKLVVNLDDDGYTLKLEYTPWAIPVVALLSLSIVLPTIYTIIGLTKIPYKN